MPRGIKGSINYEQQIKEVDDKISKLTGQIIELQIRKNELLSLKQESDMKSLYEYMNKKGLTAEAVIELIEKANKEA